MSLSATEVWDRLLARARQELPEQTFRTWLEPTAALSVDDHRIVVGTPDRFSAEWNESKHAALLSSYAPVALGHPVHVVFTVDEEREKKPQIDFFIAPPPPAAPPQRGATSGERRDGAPVDTRRSAFGPPPAISAPLNPRYTFDHFVIGKSNDVAAAASQGAAQAPGKV